MSTMKQPTLDFQITKSSLRKSSLRKNKLNKEDVNVNDDKLTPTKRSSRKKLFQDENGKEDKKLIVDKECEDVEVINDEKTSKFKKGTPRKTKLIEEFKSASSPPKKSRLKQCELQQMNCFSPASKAKMVLSTSFMNNLVGRETEYNEMKEFLSKHLFCKQSSSLYISGPAGTGKSVSVNYVINELSKDFKFKYININCMNFNVSTSIYGKISSELNLKGCTNSSEIGNHFCKSSSRSLMSIIVLDEIDQLESKSQEVLHSIFEWPTLENSKLILVGIANALDFTTRTLTRLARLGLSPALEMNFQPYNKEQIVSIIQDRINNVINKDEIIIKPAAIQLCARKVSACSGDIRKALDVCRRAIDLAQANEISVSPLKITTEHNPGSPRKSLNKTISQVDISQIMMVFNQVYGQKIDIIKSKHSLPFQQQVILCSILVFTKEKKLKEITLSKCHEIYGKICKIRGIANEAKNESDFLSMCHLLETNGYISIKNSSQIRLSKLSLQVEEDEIEQALSDKSLIKSLLQQKSNIF